MGLEQGFENQLEVEQDNHSEADVQSLSDSHNSDEVLGKGKVTDNQSDRDRPGLLIDAVEQVYPSTEKETNYCGTRPGAAPP